MLSLTVICSKTFFHLHHPLSCRSAPPTSALRAPPSKGRRDRYTRNAPHSRPFLWKGLSSVARRGWLPRMLEMRFPISLSPPLSGIALYKNRREASHLGLQRRFLDFARNDDTTRTPRLSTRRSCYFKTYFTTSYASFSFGSLKERDGLSFSVSSSFSRPSRPSVRSS